MGNFGIKPILQPRTQSSTDNSFTVTFNPSNPSLPQIPLGGAYNSGIAGASKAFSSDLNIATVSTDTQPVIVNASATNPGFVSICYVTASGAGRNISYQVYDPNGIVGYIIPQDRMKMIQGASQSINLLLNINSGTGTSTMDPASWNINHTGNPIIWISADPSVVTITANGMVTAIANGYTVIYGTVIDKWGITQTLLVPIQVSANNAISSNYSSVMFNESVPNSLCQIPLSGSITAAGCKNACSSNTSIATVSVNSSTGVTTVNANTAISGPVSVCFITATGAGHNYNLQVYDPNGIAGYSIPGGRLYGDKGTMQMIGVYLDIDNDNGVYTMPAVTWNTNHTDNPIKWKSEDSSVVAVDTNSMVTAIADGFTVILGTVTDKWGTVQTIVVPMQVGMVTSSLTTNVPFNTFTDTYTSSGALNVDE